MLHKCDPPTGAGAGLLHAWIIMDHGDGGGLGTALIRVLAMFLLLQQLVSGMHLLHELHILPAVRTVAAMRMAYPAHVAVTSLPLLLLLLNTFVGAAGARVKLRKETFATTARRWPASVCTSAVTSTRPVLV